MLHQVCGVDVVLGFEDMAGYTSAEGRGRNPYMGAVVGRVANRIADAKFNLDGKEYTLAQVSLKFKLNPPEYPENELKTELKLQFDFSY